MPELWYVSPSESTTPLQVLTPAAAAVMRSRSQTCSMAAHASVQLWWPDPRKYGLGGGAVGGGVGGGDGGADGSGALHAQMRE